MKFNISQKKKRKPLTIKTKYHEYYWWVAPVIPFFELHAWIEHQRYERMKWDAKRATKLLNKYILPKTLERVEEEKAFYYCMNWGNAYTFKNLVPRWHFRWVSHYCYAIRDFIEDGYENPDYIKSVVKEYDETWIKFEERA